MSSINHDNSVMRIIPSPSKTEQEDSFNTNNIASNQNETNYKSKSKKRKRNNKLVFPTSFLDCSSITQVLAFPSSPTVTTEKTEKSTTTNTTIFANNENINKEKKIVSTAVASNVVKEIFLDRLVKEIVRPYPLSCHPKSKSSKSEEKFVMVNGKLQKQKSFITEGNAAPSSTTIPTTTMTRSNIWNERIKMGTNQCLRILESLPLTMNQEDDDEGSRSRVVIPSLVVMARDIYPPTMLAHAPVLAKHYSIPLLILPGKASDEIGNAIGIRKASILLFLPPSEINNEIDEPDKALNSFVEFVISHVS